MVQQRHAEKEQLGNEYPDQREREELLYTLANLCTTMIQETTRGRGGRSSSAKMIAGRTIDRPGKHKTTLRRFGAVEELLPIFTGGLPVNPTATGVDLVREINLEYHPSVPEHLPAVW